MVLDIKVLKASKLSTFKILTLLNLFATLPGQCWWWWRVIVVVVTCQLSAVTLLSGLG